MTAERALTSDADASTPSAPTTGSDVTDQFMQSSGGYELVLSAVILGLIGLYIDRRIGTTPVFVLVLSFAGFVGAGASIYYRYRHRIDTLRAEAAALRREAERTAPSNQNRLGTEPSR